MNFGLDLLTVATGGACGALFRHLIASASYYLLPGSFPWATLISNLVGCFLMGLLIGSGQGEKYEAVRLGFGVGFLGSLTTFSTFSAETIKHAHDGHLMIVLVNIVANLSLCLLAVVLGIATAKRLLG